MLLDCLFVCFQLYRCFQRCTNTFRVITVIRISGIVSKANDKHGCQGKGYGYICSAVLRHRASLEHGFACSLLPRITDRSSRDKSTGDKRSLPFEDKSLSWTSRTCSNTSDYSLRIPKNALLHPELSWPESRISGTTQWRSDRWRQCEKK